jgi:hypothetical protein
MIPGSTLIDYSSFEKSKKLGFTLEKALLRIIFLSKLLNFLFILLYYD